MTRGIYYGARLISAQYGTVFTKQEYQKLQKVYSIWICPESAEKKHSITEYKLKQIQKLGNVPATEMDYDKLQVIVITLGPDGVKSENLLIRYLSLLLSREYPVESKKQQLQNEYNIEMDQELEKEMTTVCNLGEGIARKSRDEGLAQGMAQGMNKVTQLMAKLFSLGKDEEVKKATKDPEYLQKLLKEYGLVEA